MSLPEAFVNEAHLKRIVRDSVHETLASLGFTPDEPHAMQADMLYVRKAREGSDELIRVIRRSAVTIAASGLIYALVAGIKLSFK